MYSYENKKIFVLGLAKSGFSVAKLLISKGCTVVLNDLKAKETDDMVIKLRELGVTVVVGHTPVDLFDDSYDFLVKNPGVPLEHVYVEKAKRFNIPVVNEIDVAYTFMTDCTYLAITGTNGKTTTTSLVYEFLKADNKRVHLTGNIGYPLCDFVGKAEKGDFIVIEIAALQLINCYDFLADIAIFTNLTPDHIDFFKTYDNYANAKKRLFTNQTNKQLAILNAHDNNIKTLLTDIQSEKQYFSADEKVNGAYIKNDIVYYQGEEIIEVKKIKLVGKHNLENILGAICAVKRVGCSNEAIVNVLKTFRGVEHRIEFVRELNGVVYYNDSKGTNIDSTTIALRSFKQPVILLLGGLDRGPAHDFFLLTKEVNYVKMIIAYGETKNRIKEFANALMIECIVVDTLEVATEIAHQKARLGDVVLLSPACASWDQFDNYEQRGHLFKDIVNKF